MPFTSMSVQERCTYKQRILGWDFGWDLKFAFNPLRRPQSDATAMGEDDVKTCLRELNLFLWAWNMRRSFQTHPQLPPSEVFDGTDLWAKRPDWREGGQIQQPGQP